MSLWSPKVRCAFGDLAREALLISAGGASARSGSPGEEWIRALIVLRVIASGRIGATVRLLSVNGSVPRDFLAEFKRDNPAGRSMTANKETWTPEHGKGIGRYGEVTGRPPVGAGARRTDCASGGPVRPRYPAVAARHTVRAVGRRGGCSHRTAEASLSQWRWMRRMIGARFRVDVHNQRRMVEQRGSTPGETLKRFRSIIGSTTAPSGHTPAYLGEIVVHAQDSRQPLGPPWTPESTRRRP